MSKSKIDSESPEIDSSKKRRMDGFEENGGYMAVKVAKLDQQLNQSRVIAKESKSIFNGISIYIDGRTNPPEPELRSMFISNGGIYHPMLMSNTHFIIAENLARGKITKQYNSKTIHPKWILESISEKTRLDYRRYFVYKDTSYTDYFNVSENEKLKETEKTFTARDKDDKNKDIFGIIDLRDSEEILVKNILNQNQEKEKSENEGKEEDFYDQSKCEGSSQGFEIDPEFSKDFSAKNETETEEKSELEDIEDDDEEEEEEEDLNPLYFLRCYDKSIGKREFPSKNWEPFKMRCLKNNLGKEEDLIPWFENQREVFIIKKKIIEHVNSTNEPTVNLKKSINEYLWKLYQTNLITILEKILCLFKKLSQKETTSQNWKMFLETKIQDVQNTYITQRGLQFLL